MWIAHNQELADTAGASTIDGLEGARRHTRVALAIALLVAGGLGFLTFRKIVGPVRGLQSAVESIVGGDYAFTVPYTQAKDETGALARSIDVLKHGAGSMEDQRWVKTHVAALIADLQGAATLAEFGERLLSGLVPALGGGVAAFYAMEPGETRLRRTAGYGLAESGPVAGVDRSRRGARGPVRAPKASPCTSSACPGLPAHLVRPGLGGAGAGRGLADHGARRAAVRDRVRVLPRARRPRALAVGGAAAGGGAEPGGAPAQPAHAGAAGPDA